MNTRQISIQQQRNIIFSKLKTDIPFMVNVSLKEDLDGFICYKQDITSKIIDKETQITAKIITREPGIFCGKQWVEEIFYQLGNKIIINWLVNDGDFITKNQVLCKMTGQSQIILTGERTSLNFIQTLSSVSTITYKYVKQLEGTTTKLLDTRKTIPGLRTALKYAVLIGGGFNHRFGLSDSYLIKENHIISTGSISKSVSFARKLRPELSIEVEVENLKELLEAINIGVDIIMLDNFSLTMIKKAVDITNGKALLEVSGNVPLDKIKDIAKIGVDFISVGALTKNIKAMDLSMIFI
ncbi:Nicotinate-nucleotide pyrophosphorylase [carboxylating] [Candidatus Providencia siddallii]|uniref:nicotinate-nucleotide diphosphorylase (carboxylating) n=1 Tax=Candidatus Providencia siddallii TaxID=1715285 RepID=A0A0M6W6S6_9GAMM|nr:Nicotinate-nucleotide pyrophosphorylase [carboxylating] [Candidatus Providencia siddallii]